MDLLIWILVIAWGYLSCYIVSLYGLAGYVDPEELPRLIKMVRSAASALSQKLRKDSF